MFFRSSFPRLLFVLFGVAQVLDILGMSKEAQADVFETFDAELFALSRLNTTNIVKVRFIALTISTAVDYCFEYRSRLLLRVPQ